MTILVVYASIQWLLAATNVAGVAAVNSRLHATLATGSDRQNG